MRFESPVWCAKCYLRIAPYAPQTVYRRNHYHDSCFLKLAREEADQAKVSQIQAKVGQGRRRRKSALTP
jgi:hypothetical protein